MPTDTLNQALDYVIWQIAETGIRVSADPRNLAVPGVLVEPPSLTVKGRNIVELRFPIIALAPPPGNADAVRALLEIADTIAANVDNVTGGDPSTWGDKDLPAYTMSATVTIRR